MEELEGELLRHEDSEDVGTQCSCGLYKRSTRCSDCMEYTLSCSECFIQAHTHSPFHWAKVWDPTAGFFVKKDISALRGESGYAITIGHGGGPCPVKKERENKENIKEPAKKPGIPFTIVHTNGIHGTRLHFCGCFDDLPRRVLLIRSRLFPGSTRLPLTAFTLPLLRLYGLQNLQTKCSAQDFLTALQRMTDNLRPQDVPVSTSCGPTSSNRYLKSCAVPHSPFPYCFQGMACTPDTEEDRCNSQSQQRHKRSSRWWFANTLCSVQRDWSQYTERRHSCYPAKSGTRDPTKVYERWESSAEPVQETT